MKYTQEQIAEMRATILAIKIRTEDLEDLVAEAQEITRSTNETYSLSFSHSRGERSFKIPALSLLDLYNENIANLKLEILSREKRLQELVK